MDHRDTERFMAHMAEMQPQVPEWCKAEHMEISMPQKELWRYETDKHSNVMKQIIKRIFNRQKRRKALTKITIEQIPLDQPEKLLIRCHDPNAPWVARIKAAASP